MFVSQISVFLENVRGSLRNMTELLGENEVNLLALTIADTSGFGVVRIIVKSDDIESTLNVLHQSGYIAKTNKVICVRVPHKPMGLAKVMASLMKRIFPLNTAIRSTRAILKKHVSLFVRRIRKAVFLRCKKPISTQ
jgi:hypothetical protein